ncbi:PH domain-containing protein [Entamoeba marina]
MASTKVYTFQESNKLPQLSKDSLSHKYMDVLNNSLCPGGSNNLEILITSHTPEVTQQFLNKWGGLQFSLAPNHYLYINFPYEGRSELQARISTLVGYEELKLFQEMHFSLKKAFVVVISQDEIESINTLNEVFEFCVKSFGLESIEAKSVIAVFNDPSVCDTPSIRLHAKERGIHIASDENELCSVLAEVYKNKGSQNDLPGASNPSDNMDILVLGDALCGKTTLVSKILEEEQSGYMQTKNFSTRSKTIQISKSFHLKIIDSPGNIRELGGFDPVRTSQSIITCSTDKAMAILKQKNLLGVGVIYLVYDMSNQDSYDYAVLLMQKYHAVSQNTKFVVFGNKKDVAEEFEVDLKTSDLKSKADLYFETSFTTITTNELRKIVNKTIKYAKPGDVLPKIEKMVGPVSHCGSVYFGDKKPKKVYMKLNGGVLKYADSEKELEKKGKCLSLSDCTVKELEIESKKGKEAKEALLEVIVNGESHTLKAKTVEERTTWENALINTKITSNILLGVKKQILEELIVVASGQILSELGNKAISVTGAEDKTYDFPKEPPTSGVTYVPKTFTGAATKSSKSKDSKKDKKDKKDKKKK